MVKKSYDYCRNVCLTYLKHLPMGCCKGAINECKSLIEEKRKPPKPTLLERNHISYITS